MGAAISLIVPAIMSAVQLLIGVFSKPPQRPAAIQPAHQTSVEELVTHSRAVGVDPVRRYNVAVAGLTGSGKSTFVNVVRGLRDYDDGAAAVGVVETTMVKQEYQHPSCEHLSVWDLPGGGTDAHPGKLYWYDNALYAFDAVLLFYSGKAVPPFVTECIAQLRSIDVSCVLVKAKVDEEVKDLVERGLNERDACQQLRSLTDECVARDVGGGVQLYMVSSRDLRSGRARFDEAALLKYVADRGLLRH